MNTRRPSCRIALLVIAAGACAAPAHAQTISFDNSCGNGLWNGSCGGFVPPDMCSCTNNWDTGESVGNPCPCPRVPGASDDVYIDSSYSVHVDYSNPIHSLTALGPIYNTYIIEVSGDATYYAPVTAAGAFLGAGSHTFLAPVNVEVGNQGMSFRWPTTGTFNADVNAPAGASIGVESPVYNHATLTWGGGAQDWFLIDGAYGGGTQACFHNTQNAACILTGDGPIRGLIGLGHYENSGLFRKEGGPGTSQVLVDFQNTPTGVIDLRTGTLDFGTDSGFNGSAVLAAGTTMQLRATNVVPNAFSVTGDGLLVNIGRTRIAAGATLTVRNCAMVNTEQNLGLFAGPGAVSFTNSVELGGEFSDDCHAFIAPGATGVIAQPLNVSGGTFTNQGLCIWKSGTVGLADAGLFVNDADMDCRGSNTIMGGYGFTTGSMLNTGLLHRSTQGQTGFALPVINTGTVRVEAGLLGFTDLRQTEGQILLAGGELFNDYQQQPVRIEGGVVTGNGNIRGNLVNAGGVIAPGNSAGTISIINAVWQPGNTFTQGPGGTLAIQIGGLDAGTGFDQLVVGAEAILDGTLNVSLINGFEPHADDAFDVVVAGHVTGQFSNAVLPDGFSVRSLNDRVRLYYLHCIADFNYSGGTPDDADIAAFFAAWNNGEDAADVNHSGGTPDDADVAYFFFRWNAGC